jgi:hypothetical protein
MINKNTVEEAWKRDPNKIYYVIQNPKVDKDSRKLVGLTLKTVEYRVKDWDSKYINFERVDKDADKRFPEIIPFDKRYPDAENEVITEKVSNAKKKPESLISFGIFGDKKLAKYHKLVRMHRLAEQMRDIYKAMKNSQEKPETSVDDNKLTKDAKAGIDKSKIDISAEDVKRYFEEIQDTGYFEELEMIQTEFPDLAAK